MFMIEIAGIRILYTGDFSRLEDRHLCAAELPNISPDILISVRMKKINIFLKNLIFLGINLRYSGT